MHFGMFVEEKRHEASQASAFRDIFELADRAEAWGIDCVWLGEIHFTPVRSVISASLQVASAIAARTRRLHIGTAVQVLPLNHPLRIAEEVATVDHISEGRFEFGIGRSGVVRSYDTYGVPYGESQARFREALEIIRRAWTGEPFSYEGEFYRVQNATVAPRPYQVPHPPIRMAATSDETFPAAGPDGIAHLRRAPRHGDRRSAGPARAVPTTPGARRVIPASPASTCASRSTSRPPRQGAREEPRESLTAFFARQSELARSAVGRAGDRPRGAPAIPGRAHGQSLLRRHPGPEGGLRHRRPA